MNRNEAISAISDATDISRKDVTAILDAQDKLLIETLKAGKEFTLGKSGKIVPKTSPARKGRNPSTGEEIDIAAKNSAKFKPSKDLVATVA